MKRCNEYIGTMHLREKATKRQGETVANSWQFSLDEPTVFKVWTVEYETKSDSGPKLVVMSNWLKDRS